MDSAPFTPATIDEYIAGFPPNVQEMLQKVRTTIREAAPDATEAIKYQIPTFVFHGNLVSFAGYAKHIGLYPVPSDVDGFREDLAPYASGKATAKFPLNKPIPYDLISRIVRFRVEESLAKATAKKK